MKHLRLVFLVVGIGISCSLQAQSIVLEDSVKGNSLHKTVRYAVYFPEKDMLQKGNLPVLYLLHGLGHVSSDWIGDGMLPSVVEELRKDEQIRDMVVIMPNTRSRKSSFFDVEGSKYETFFFNEFLPVVERKYNVGGEKGKRAIGGFSMGGGAAVVYALKHPDLFSSVCAMSALVGLPMIQPRVDGLEDTDMLAFGQSVLANDCMALLAYLGKNHLEQVKKVGWILDCGDDDFLLELNIRFYLQMRKMNIPCELRVREGNHDWEYWRSSLYNALPFFSRHFSR